MQLQPGVLADHQIRELCFSNNMVVPFSEHTSKDEAGNKIISYGLSSYGYDMRVARKFQIFDVIKGSSVDPKNFSDDCFTEVEGDSILIPPNSFALAHTVESFNIPRDVVVVCIGKSTYARTGLIVNVTPLEPEWSGVLTLELSNTTPLPIRVYANEGIAQLLFFVGSAACETSYADRKGKYMGQKGIVHPRLVD